MRRFKPLPSFAAVAAGQTATLDIPARGTYYSLMLSYTTSTSGGATQANMETEITEIRLKINGKIQRRFSAEELFDINTYKGQTITAGKLQIYFAEPWRQTVQGEEALAWPMGDVDTFQIEVDIANNSSQTCSLSASAQWNKNEAPMGPIVKWRKFTVPVSATGITNVTTFPKADAYMAIHGHSANISDVEVTVDGEEVFDATLAEAQELQKNYGNSPVSGWFHIDYAYTNRVSDALPMRATDGKAVAEYRVDFNMSSAASFTAITETLGLRD